MMPSAEFYSGIIRFAWVNVHESVSKEVMEEITCKM